MGNRNRKGGQFGKQDQNAQNQAEKSKKNKENNQAKVASFQTIQNGLKRGIEETIGEDKKRSLENTLAIVTTIQQKTDKIKRDFVKNPDEALNNFEDPFEDLKKIHNTAIVAKIVTILLKDVLIKKYLAYQCSDIQIGLRADKLREIARTTKEKDLRDNINDFLTGIEDLKNPDGKYREENIKEMKVLAEKIRREMKNQINLETIFESQPDLKRDLADEINMKIVGKKYSVETYGNNDDDPEEVEEDSVTYKALSKFFKNHLADDKINGQIIVTKNEYNMLKEEIERLFREQSEDEFPNIKIFFEMMGNPEIVQIPAEVAPVQPEEAPNFDIESEIVRPAEPKKVEKDTSGWTYGTLAAVGMKGMDLGFKMLMTMIFSPVSAAIWASKEMMRLSKNGEAKMTMKDFVKDVFPVSAFDPDKDKKK